jgi:hypothetical protein
MFMVNSEFYESYVPMFVHVIDYSYGSYYRLVTPTREAIWNVIQLKAQTTKMQRDSFTQTLPHRKSVVINRVNMWKCYRWTHEDYGIKNTLEVLCG